MLSISELKVFPPSGRATVRKSLLKPKRNFKKSMKVCGQKLQKSCTMRIHTSFYERTPTVCIKAAYNITCYSITHYTLLHGAGLQEYIEAVTFFHYLENETLVDLATLTKRLQFSEMVSDPSPPHTALNFK